MRIEEHCLELGELVFGIEQTPDTQLKKEVRWEEMKVKSSEYFLIYKYYIGHFHSELYLSLCNK